MEEHTHHHPAAAAIEVCFNCSVPFDDLQQKENFDDEILPSSPQQFTPSSEFKMKKVHEIIIPNSSQSDNTTTTTISVSRALSSIFKLNYLTAFSHEEEENDEQKLWLCYACSEVLTQLYSLFNCFIQLQKLDSSLAHRIERLDEIIDSHEQRKIHCDLISEPRKHYNNFDTSTNKNYKLNPSSQTDAKCQVKVNNNVIFDREPRIVLTRLPMFSTPQEQQQFVSVKEEVPDLDITFDDSPWEPTIHCSFDEDYSRESFLDDDLPTKTEDSDPKKEESDEEWTQPSTRRGRPAKKNMKKGLQLRPQKIIERSIKKSRQPKEKTCRVSLSSKMKSSSEIHSSQSSEQVERVNYDVDTSSCLEKLKADSLHPDDVVVVVKKKVRGPYKKKERPPKPKPEKKEKVKRTKSGIPIPRKKKEDYELDPNFKTRNVTSYKIRRTKVPNPCWYCRLHFPTLELLLEHTRQNHSSKMTPFSQMCLRCSKICDNRFFPSHVKRCELVPMGVILPRPFKCPECPNVYATAGQLRLHSVVHSNDRPFACDKCSYVSKTEQILSKHMANVHEPVVEPEDPRRKCDECGAVLKNERYLRWHKVHRHTPEGLERYWQQQERSKAKQTAKRKARAMGMTTVCNICSVDFFTRASLTFHRKAEHPDAYESASVCPLCGRSFSRVNSLSTHMKDVHSDARPYLCQKCGRDFKTAQNLKKHDLHTHDEEGRLQYNAKTRERNRRRKLLMAQKLANNVHPQQQQHQQIIHGQQQQQQVVMMDQDCSSNGYFE